jgi:predicted transcriptional regulator
MMPYGTAADELVVEEDKDEVDTGVKILKWLREQEAKNLGRLWVAVVTARGNFGVLRKTEKLLNGHGRLFLKPLNRAHLEHYVVTAMGIDSLVPEVLQPAKKE